MNKYVILTIIIVIALVGGLGYQKFLQPDSAKGIETGVVREISVVSEKNQWKFEPAEIEVNQGDRVILIVENKDSYDHGLAIDAFGVSQRMLANSITRIEFVATQPGEFPYYCSVPCGSGVVEGVERGHFDQTGVLKVKAAAPAVLPPQ
jgi:heme/copper-type cytochrome/quinol oxidase subunit 2